MTPREADVAFVLEGLPGVLAVRAFRANATWDYAVHLASVRAMVRAHYMLLRVIRHVDCERVLFHREALSSTLEETGTLLELTPSEREAARARVPAMDPREGVGALPAIDPSQMRVLVVDDTPDTTNAITRAVPRAKCVVEPDPKTALARAREEPFERFVCDSEHAFGPEGFLVRLQAVDPFAATRVVVVADRTEHHFAVSRMAGVGRVSAVLVRPLEDQALVGALEYDWVEEPWLMRVRGSGPRTRRILVIDDDPASARLVRASQESDADAVGITLGLARDGHEALERLDAQWDAVVCSLAMKAESGAPMYQFLWDERPESKRRFALLAAPDSPPVSRIAHVITRPLALEPLAIFLDAFEQEGQTEATRRVERRKKPTPREADVAFVLEAIEGVVAVQAFRGHPHLDFAISVDGARAMARAHAALLRVLTHLECRRVLFYYDAMPSPLALKAEDLVLTAGERAAARARVPATSSALEEGRGLPPVDPTQKRILVVDARPDTASAVAASAPDALCVVEPNVEAALVRARVEPFDMFLCDADRAFGDNGFLVRLAAIDAFGVTRVTVVAHAQDLRFTMNRLEQIGRINSVLTHPLDVGTLTLAIRYGGIYVESWKIAAPSRSERPPVRRVLLVDDDPASIRLVTASQTTDVGGVGLIFTLAKDAWEALEHIGAEWDAIVCSIAMKTESGVPVYRVLWNNRPELKARFAFLASSDGAPLSGAARVITRPLSLEAVATFIDVVERR